MDGESLTSSTFLSPAGSKEMLRPALRVLPRGTQGLRKAPVAACVRQSGWCSQHQAPALRSLPWACGHRMMSSGPPSTSVSTVGAGGRSPGGAGEGGANEVEDTRIGGIPGVLHAEGGRMAIIYTCKVCETRSAKGFSRRAYEHGVVLIRCPGCENLHLVADRLGYFEDSSWDIKGFLEKVGGRVTAVNDDNVMELTPLDMVGSGSDPETGSSGQVGGVGCHPKA